MSGRRTQLPPRRPGITETIAFGEQCVTVTYGFNRRGRIKEFFLNNLRVGAHLEALISDACIMASCHLQDGDSAQALAARLGENRAEGAASGPPASLIGAIARRAVAIEAEEIRALHRPRMAEAAQ